MILNIKKLWHNLNKKFIYNFPFQDSCVGLFAGEEENIDVTSALLAYTKYSY